MAINIIQGYNPSTVEPIDSRLVKADQAARYAIPSFGAYNGLVVYQQDTQELYVLTDTGNINNSAGWKKVGDSINTGSFATTGSNIFKGSQEISGALQLNPTQDPGPSNTSSSFFFVSSSNDNTEYNLHYRNNGALWETHWLEERTDTGIVWGGVVTTSGSTIYVSPGAGIIVNHNASTSSHGDTIPSYVTFGPITSSATYITSSQITYLLIDENGSLIQQTSIFTPEQYNEKFPLGYIFSLTTSSISSYADARVTTYGQDEQQSQFIRAFGPLKVSGYDLTPQSSSLKLSIGSGRTYRNGGFYSQDPNNPSIYDSNSVATGSLVRIYRDPSVVGGFRAQTQPGGLPFTDIDPTKWDDGSGTLQNVSSSEWTIQRLFQEVVNNVTYTYYGQNTYSSLISAIQSISTEPFEESPTSIIALPFIGYVITKGDTTDLTDATNNKIINSGLFRNTAGSSGGGGVATTNLSDLADVTITTPSTGQALVYNAGIWENGVPLNSTSASYAQTASSAFNAQDILILVQNNSGQDISKGIVVHITASGNSSDVPRIITASYENDNNSANTLGITNQLITNGSQGYVMTEGVLKGIDTDSFQSGQLIYLGPTGSIIGSAPQAPLHGVRLGQVVRKQNINGSIYVSINNGYELDELHDVRITTASLQYGNLLMRSSSVWINTNQLSGSYALTGSLNATSFTGSLQGTSSWATSASFAVSGGNQGLQSVTENGASTNQTVSITDGSYLYVVDVDSQTTVTADNIVVEDVGLSTYTQINPGELILRSSDINLVDSKLKNTNVVNGGVELEFPNKLPGSYTIATTDDVITASYVYLDVNNVTQSLNYDGTTYVNLVGNRLRIIGNNSIAISASNGTTFAGPVFLPVATYNITASNAVSSLNAVSSSYALSASFASSSSFANLSKTANTASFVDPLSQTVLITGSLIVTGSSIFTGSITQGVGISTGISSYAQGFSVTASGDYSHAEGNAAQALFPYSHAEGFRTEASGSYTHAEGRQTNASGLYSHAEGTSTKAIGEGSHAEGNNTIAIGTHSHAEGFRTSASANISHAEGSSSLAAGTGSHAEGFLTTASGNYSHAEGEFTFADGYGSHTEGSLTTASGASSHAEGLLTRALANYSHAEGAETLTEGSNYTHAEGYQVTASGFASHAEGYQVKSLGQYSHAEGQQTIASGSYSHAEGIKSVTISEGSHAEGEDTFASGYVSHTEGFQTVTSGSYSHAEGYKTLALNSSSHSEGFFTTASGEGAHAEGYITLAFGDTSHAEGQFTTASGAYSHAEGWNTLALGYVSHAEGRDSQAVGSCSHVEGYNNIAVSDYQHVQGIYNLPISGSGAFIVGNGTSNIDKRNLIFASGSQVQITGSLVVTGSISGSAGVVNPLTASYAITASYALTPPTWTAKIVSGSNYTASRDEFVLVSASSYTVLLPAASANAKVAVKWIVAPPAAGGAIRTSGSGVTIDGTDRSVTGLGIYNQWDSYSFISDGINWYIIG